MFSIECVLYRLSLNPNQHPKPHPTSTLPPSPRPPLPLSLSPPDLMSRTPLSSSSQKGPRLKQTSQPHPQRTAAGSMQVRGELRAFRSRLLEHVLKNPVYGEHFLKSPFYGEHIL